VLDTGLGYLWARAGAKKAESRVMHGVTKVGVAENRPLSAITNIAART